jgi:hypothetical protein
MTQKVGEGGESYIGLQNDYATAIAWLDPQSMNGEGFLRLFAWSDGILMCFLFFRERYT